MQRNDEATMPTSNGDGDHNKSASTARKKPVAVCTTDPDATLTKNHRARRAEPAYKQHTAVDGQRGVVLDVEVTTGAAHDSRKVEEQLDAVAGLTGRAI